MITVTNINFKIMKMKKIFLILNVIVIALSSCQDGDLGLSRFQVTNDSGNAYNVYFSDPNLPSTLYTYTFYDTKAGNYTYSYDYGIYNYSGSYTIVQEPGESWNGITNGLLTQPESGSTRKYTFDFDAASGSELTYTKNLMVEHKDIIIDKIIYFNGGKLIIKGKGVYDPKHLLSKTKNTICTKK